jgi:hypothetical protein
MSRRARKARSALGSGARASEGGDIFRAPCAIHTGILWVTGFP